MGSVRASREPVLGWDCLSAPKGACQRLAFLFFLHVTQCLAECWPWSVLRTEVLAKGGQGSEQAVRLCRGSWGWRRLAGKWSRVTGDLVGTLGSQGPMPGEECVR